MSKESEQKLNELEDYIPWTTKLWIHFVYAWYKSLSKEGKMQLLIKVLSSLLKLDFLEGYRSTLAGVASILAGISLLILYAAGDPRGDVEKGVTAIILGVGFLGHAGKMDKLIATEKKQGRVDVS